MSLTPAQVTQRLIDLELRLDELVKEFKQVNRAAAEAKRTAEVAYARTYMQSTGPVEERKQTAILETADQRFTLDLAERSVSSCREALRAQHAHIEAARTMSATTRDEMKLAGSGVHP